MSWPLARRLVLLSLPLSCLALLLAWSLGEVPLSPLLWVIGCVGALFFLGGFAVIPFSRRVQSLVLSGSGPLGEARRLLGKVVRAERTVVATRKALARCVLALWGLLVLGLALRGYLEGLALNQPRAVETALFFALGGCVFGSVPLVLLLHTIKFFVFAKGLNPRQCALAEGLLARLRDRLEPGHRVELRCQLKGYEASGPSPEERFVEQAWDHDWLSCAVRLDSGADLSISLVQRAAARFSLEGSVSLLPTWRTELFESAKVVVRLDPGLFPGVKPLLEGDLPPIEGCWLSMTTEDTHTLRASAVTGRAQVRTQEGEVTTGDEGALLDAGRLWAVVEGCLSGVALIDFRREIPLELLPPARR